MRMWKVEEKMGMKKRGIFNGSPDDHGVQLKVVVDAN